MLKQILVILCVATCLQVAQADERPNVLVILVDDLGYGDLSSYGAQDLKSPHVDQLLAEGMTFTEFYANCPVCSPTRAALLSGRYQDMVGVPGVIRTHPENSWGNLVDDAVLLPSVLKKNGYNTACVGKWHLGLESPDRPTDRGFDFFKGYLGDMMDDYYNHRRHGINYMRQGTEEIDPEGHATDLFTDWSCEYIREQKDDSEPFFLYLAYNAPHTPIQPPEEWFQKVKAREQGISDKRAKLVALIEHLDEGIGKVLVCLKETGQAENTIVVFTSDNGGQINVGANNGPLRDGKQSMYEGGLKVPCGVRWPGKIQPGTKSKFRGLTMDIFPTVCEAAGVELDKNLNLDSKSFLPTCLGKEQEELRDLWFFRRREGGARYAGKTIEAVRRGDWKLLQNSPFEPLELYNLKNDPLEKNDLSKKAPKIFNELSAALRAEIQRYGTVPWQ
ncbi:sulfatase family protein [Thalassoglobus polymorphus]|uniref:Arylsulfatase n=1 Tax=Thalassoglobus polymorphus TaxID=2527994 RepID=A0A517QJP5_9PLAN|nr:sulfatase-like hydrolase/transferase [Thalassoglobus polymorphus]QDT31862.1 Arylsulfatase [Thalassoglobus polymorphus]